MKICIELTPDQADKLLSLLARIGESVEVTTERPTTKPSEEHPNGQPKENLTTGRTDAKTSRLPGKPALTVDDLKAAIVIAGQKITDPALIINEVERLTGVRRAALVPEHLYQTVIDRLHELSEEK